MTITSPEKNNKLLLTQLEVYVNLFYKRVNLTKMSLIMLSLRK